jgi:arsenate reductase
MFIQNKLKYLLVPFIPIAGERLYRVLFICTHNSARSQMAEGLVNHLYPKNVRAYSAGTVPGAVHPLAIEVMTEVGIDISKHRSKHLREFEGEKFDLAVTVCDGANEICPFFPGAKDQDHAGFPDPSAAQGSVIEKLEAFRKTRDDILLYIRERFDTLG